MSEVQLEPMTEAAYAEFRERSEASSAAEIAASRAVRQREARRRAAEDHADRLPLGLWTKGHYLWTGIGGRSPRR